MTNEKPKVKLVGTDGNAFAIMGKVSQALKRAGQPDKAAEFQRLAMSQPSYDALLALVFDYVEVE